MEKASVRDRDVENNFEEMVSTEERILFSAMFSTVETVWPRKTNEAIAVK